MKPRFPIGLSFERKRYPKAPCSITHNIEDIYTTRNSAGEVVKIEYKVSHEFMGQRVSEFMIDTTIARSLTNEQLKEFV